MLAILDHVPTPLPAVNLGSTSSTPHPGLGQGSKRAHACNALQGTDGNRNPSEGLKERSVLILSNSAVFSQVQVTASEHKSTDQEQPGCSQNSRFLPHFCTKISAAENCFFQEGQAVPSVRAQKAQLARQAGSSPLKQRNAGEEGFSSFKPGMSDRQSSQYVTLWRSFHIAVVYLGTLDLSFDPLCATATQQTNHLRAGSSLAARCCIQSKTSQDIKSKARSDNLPAQPQLSCPWPEIQITTSSSSSAWISGKPDTKSSLLKTRRLYLQHPQRVTCRRSSCRTCCCLWDSLQCFSPPDGLTKRSWLFTRGLQKQPCQDLLNLNI